MKRLVNATQARHRPGATSPASQTLVRGLDMLEVVARGPLVLPALANRLGLARSTTHRLATALVERRYLTLVPREGYGLGPKLLELGSCAQEQTTLLRAARPYLDRLAEESLDTALLWIGDASIDLAAFSGCMLLERVPGRRRLMPALRVGERVAMTGGAAGFAFMLDDEAAWRSALPLGQGDAAMPGGDFLAGMRLFARLGYAYGTVEGVRSVAAPVRDVKGEITAAIGLASAALYTDDARLASLGQAVAEAAAALSADLGFGGLEPALHTMAVRVEAKTHPGTNLPSDNEQFERAGSTRHLEAGARSVHDPTLQGSRRAANPDNGVTLRPAPSAPAKSG